MKHRVFVLLVLAAISLSLLLMAPLMADDQSERYVVVFNANKIPQKAAQSIAAAGGELVKTFPQVGIGIVASSNPSFAESLRGVKGIHAVAIEGYHMLPDVILQESTVEDGPDPSVDTYYYAYQWDIRRVKADLALDITSGSHDTVVAVLDTRIAFNHPDLSPNVIYATCYSVYSSCNPYPTLHWHGTHVAGTVAAAFGGGRAVGVAPNIGLASYNVFELTSGGSVVAYDEAIWQAMLDVVDQGFDVISMSLGSYIMRSYGAGEVAYWTAWNRIADYVTRQGVVIVASAGNEGENLNGPLDHLPSDVTGVICVGASGIRPDPIFPQPDFYDVLADYSNYGAPVTLVAPGGDYGPDGTPYPYPAVYYLVFSTYPTGYAWAGGTSMAVPHVSGIAGLIRDLHPELNPHQVIVILKQTAENLGNR